MNEEMKQELIARACNGDEEARIWLEEAEAEKQAKHSHYAFGLDNWGCGKLPSGEPMYEGEEVVEDIQTGEKMSATKARQAGYKFID